MYENGWVTKKITIRQLKLKETNFPLLCLHLLILAYTLRLFALLSTYGFHGATGARFFKF